MLRKLSGPGASSGSGSANTPDHSKENELVSIVERGRWEKVKKLIKRRRLPKRLDTSGLSPLALFVTSFAPIEVVKLMLEYDPESTTKADEFGATPLHLACLNGTTAETVKLILEHDNGRSARMVDQDQYTVLHHAVEYICLMIEKRSSLPSEGSISILSEHAEYMQVIELLCNAAPEMVLHKTKDSGDTPLDIPQIILCRQSHPGNRQCKRVLDVYKILKRTSVKLYMHRKRLWEGESPENKKGNSDHSLPSLESSNQSSNQSSSGGPQKFI